MARRTLTLTRRRSPVTTAKRRTGPSPALVKARKTALAYKARLAAARRRGQAGGALSLPDAGLIIAGGGARGLAVSIADYYWPSRPWWADPGVLVGGAGLALNYFGIVKGKWGRRLAYASAGMLAASASEFAEALADRYLVDMLPGGAGAPELSEAA